MDEGNRADELVKRQAGYLPEHLGLTWSEVRHGLARGEFTVARHHMGPNGYTHAGSVISLADTACGYGCLASLPEGAESFTTMELKANFLGTARAGERVTGEARLVHSGRTTQVWDAEVRLGEDGKIIALFRCTQMLLYPRKP